MHLGVTDTGLEEQSARFTSRSSGRSALNLCDMIAGAVGGQDRRAGGTIGRLIKWNYGDCSPSQLPRLAHSGLDADELAESLNALAPLVQFGLLTPEDDLERAIRERIGAGELPDQAARTRILTASQVVSVEERPLSPSVIAS